jgi:hypothetical protein
MNAFDGLVTSRALSGSAQRGVVLLDADAELRSALSLDEREVARRYLVARQTVLEPGEWQPPREADVELGLLVLDGVLLREVCMHRRSCAELLGAGDIIRPWDQADALDASVASDCGWEVLERTRVAVLDERVTALLCRWPQLVPILMERMVRRTRLLATQMTLTQLPGVDLRLQLILWHFADRWGRVTPAGVVVPIRLTHDMLGRLIGAQRPSVTSALGRLGREGLVVRQDDGSWLLHGTPDEFGAPDRGAAPGVGRLEPVGVS